MFENHTQAENWQAAKCRDAASKTNGIRCKIAYLCCITKRSNSLCVCCLIKCWDPTFCVHGLYTPSHLWRRSDTECVKLVLNSSFTVSFLSSTPFTRSTLKILELGLWGWHLSPDSSASMLATAPGVKKNYLFNRSGSDPNYRSRIDLNAFFNSFFLPTYFWKRSKTKKMEILPL